MKALTLIAALFIAATTQFGLTACNTMEGVGEDVETLGEKIEKKAEEKKTY